MSDAFIEAIDKFLDSRDGKKLTMQEMREELAKQYDSGEYLRDEGYIGSYTIPGDPDYLIGIHNEGGKIEIFIVRNDLKAHWSSQDHRDWPILDRLYGRENWQKIITP